MFLDRFYKYYYRWWYQIVVSISSSLNSEKFKDNPPPSGVYGSHVLLQSKCYNSWTEQIGDERVWNIKIKIWIRENIRCTIQEVHKGMNTKIIYGIFIAS